jgi:AcrR family transcriptional regulator
MTDLVKLVSIMTEVIDQLLGVLQEFLWPQEREKQRAKRQRVIVAATHHFLRFGYQKASMDEIAINAGVSKGALYLYFPSKLNLLFSALAYEGEQYFQHHLAMKDLQWTPRQRLKWMIGQSFAHHETSPLSTKMRSQTSDFSVVMADYSQERETFEAIRHAEMGLLDALIADLLGSSFDEAEIKIISGMTYDLIAGLVLVPETLRQTPLSQFDLATELIISGLEHLKPGELLEPKNDEANRSNPILAGASQKVVMRQ